MIHSTPRVKPRKGFFLNKKKWVILRGWIYISKKMDASCFLFGSIFKRNGLYLEDGPPHLRYVVSKGGKPSHV